MSDPEDVTTRLSHALDEILKGGPAPPEVGDEARPTVVPDPYRLPEIVPATVEVPVFPEDVQPTLPPTPPEPDPRQVPIVVDPVLTPTITAAAAASPPSAPPTTSWGDHLPQPSHHTGPQLRAPGRRPRVRRVTRVVRHIDPWSTFKLGLVFSLVGYLVMLTSGVLLWRVADSTGTLDNVERWFTQFGWETFEFDGGEIFHNAWIIGLFGAVALTGAAVLAATLFNLVSDIVGGIRVTVLEEEVVERTASSARRYVVRRPPLAGPSAAAAWDIDDPAPAPAAATSQPPTAAAPPPPVASSGAEWSVDDEPVSRAPT